MITITATHINYYHVCHRKLWLFAHGIGMEHTSAVVADGKLLHAHSYPQRSEKYTEIEVGGSKIDFYDPKRKVIHETKRGDSMEAAHVWQVKYYIWLLEQQGVDGVTGVIEYPRMRETQQVVLLAEDIDYLKMIVEDIGFMVNQDVCSGRIEKRFCKACSYFDFCWIGE